MKFRLIVLEELNDKFLKATEYEYEPWNTLDNAVIYEIYTPTAQDLSSLIYGCLENGISVTLTPIK